MQEMDIIPKSGRRLLYVELTAVTSGSIKETLQLLQGMGYAPEVRFFQPTQTPEKIYLYAVLKDEPMCEGWFDSVSAWNEFRRLCAAIQPTTAVSSAWGRLPAVATA